MTHNNVIGQVKASIIRRSKKRQLHGTLDHLRYFNTCFFENVPDIYRKKVLYVGCGHGLDAMLAILDGHIDTVIGIDPYEKGGNDDEDYIELVNLIERCSLKDRFIVKRTDCESYINGIEDEFDLVVAVDVMHHIFATRSLLHVSPLYPRAVALFKSFANAMKPQGMIAISEVHRDGLRPMLKRLGLLKTHFSYGNKQNWREWNRPAVETGWKLKSVKNYVPYAFRAQRWLWGGILGHKTLCDRYFLYHEK